MADYKDIRQELDWMESICLSDYADEVAELRKENDSLKSSLAGESLTDKEFVTVYKDSLKELIEHLDGRCRRCPASFEAGECEDRSNCEKAMMQFLCHDWEGLRVTVKEDADG